MLSGSFVRWILTKRYQGAKMPYYTAVTGDGAELVFSDADGLLSKADLLVPYGEVTAQFGVSVYGGKVQLALRAVKMSPAK